MAEGCLYGLPECFVSPVVWLCLPVYYTFYTVLYLAAVTKCSLCLLYVFMYDHKFVFVLSVLWCVSLTRWKCISGLADRKRRISCWWIGDAELISSKLRNSEEVWEDYTYPSIKFSDTRAGLLIHSLMVCCGGCWKAVVYIYIYQLRQAWDALCHSDIPSFSGSEMWKEIIMCSHFFLSDSKDPQSPLLGHMIVCSRTSNLCVGGELLQYYYLLFRLFLSCTLIRGVVFV